MSWGRSFDFSRRDTTSSRPAPDRIRRIGCGDLFERLLDVFLAHWKGRGLDLSDPPGPLPAIVFPDERSFKAYAAADAGRFGEESKGYYSIRTNRIVLYDLTAGKGKNGRHAAKFAPPRPPSTSPRSCTKRRTKSLSIRECTCGSPTIRSGSPRGWRCISRRPIPTAATTSKRSGRSIGRGTIGSSRFLAAAEPQFAGHAHLANRPLHRFSQSGRRLCRGVGSHLLPQCPTSR